MTMQITTQLPPADTFDFLPPLYALLRRLQQPSGLELPSEGATLERTKSGDDHSKLDIANLDTAASAIRRKIQKAKGIVKEMPDSDRTVEEQQEDIGELELRVKRQKSMLMRLGVDLDTSKANGT